MSRTLLCSLVALCLFTVSLAVAGQAADKDTAKAAATRKKLKQKVTVNFKETLFRDVVDEIKDQVSGIGIRLDNKGGVSNNKKLTYSAKDKPLEEVLNEMLGKEGLGWYVISKQNDAYDGTIWIKQGKERGYPVGQEPKDK